MIGLVFGLDGFGTNGHLARWVNGEVLNNSNIIDDGVSVNVSLPLYVEGVRINSSGSVVNNYYNITNTTVNNYTTNETRYPVNLTATEITDDTNLTLCRADGLCMSTIIQDDSNSYSAGIGLYLSTSTFNINQSWIYQNSLNYTSQRTISPLNDYSGNGNTLTNNGAVYNTTEGNYYYDGVNDYMTSNINMRNRTVGYISLWFMPSGNSSSFNRLISAEGTSAANGTAITYRASTGYVYPAYSPSSQITGFYVGNNLTHIVMTWNGTNVSIYINSVFRASISQIDNAYASFIYIGRAYYSASGYFNGSIDNVQIGNRSLSSSEVLALYNNQSINSSGLVAYYPFSNFTIPNGIDTYLNTTYKENLNQPNFLPPTLLGVDTRGTMYADTTAIPLRNSNLTYNPLDDRSGNGNTLTNNGAAYNQTGGNYEYNTASQLRTLGIPNISSNITISAYINSKVLSGDKYIVARADFSSYTNDAYDLYTSGSNIRLILQTGTTSAQQNIFASTTTITTNTWYHLVVVQEGTNISFYINGINAGCSKVAGLYSCSNFTGTINGYSGYFAVGSTSGTTKYNGFNGSIDNVMIYNRSLSSSEVLAWYNNQTINNSGLVAWYPFDSGLDIRPECNNINRGLMYNMIGGTNTNDYTVICSRNENMTYYWRTIG